VRALAFFQQKGLKPSFSYADMLGDAHSHAFTVAKMMDVDLLATVRDSLDSALANGVPFKQWAESITPVLQASGWWGRKKVVDTEADRLVVAQLGSPSRLETIWRTNLQAAYAAGAWQEIEAQKGVAPFLMYDAIDDFRTRPLHSSWDRTVLPVGHKWWRTHYPPNGYNCRCGVIQLDGEQLEHWACRRPRMRRRTAPTCGRIPAPALPKRCRRASTRDSITTRARPWRTRRRSCWTRRPRRS
jgi:SPP1 gp7 family putative phage head morphogenesis protein